MIRARPPFRGCHIKPTSIMDNLQYALPACAQLRRTGTVITKEESYRIRDIGRTNFVSTPEKCELCGRTRKNSQYSDCDSESVKKHRPHRSSTARSRYVNVCAAVCLLLLVGDLSPQSAAAPRPRRDKMENPSWANPCDLADGSSTKSSKNFTSNDARRVANQAKAALDEARKFKDLFARNLQSFDTFNETWDDTPWLRSKAFVTDYILPKEKNEIDKELPPEYLSKVTSNIKDQLPAMYKALKMVAAGLYAIKEQGLQQEQYNAERELKPYFDSTFNRVRQVLCVFNEVMLTLEKEIIPLMDDEIPTMQADRISTMYMIYRDTMLYLDYLRQVMNHWASTS